MEKLDIPFDDDSIFDLTTQNKAWVDAFKTKAKDNHVTPKEALDDVHKHVDEHWKNRTVLTKFGVEEWAHSYDNKAELCKDCMYAYLRAYLMAFVMDDLSKGKGKKEIPCVVTIEEDGFKVITREGARAVKDLDEALGMNKQSKDKKKA